MVKKGEVSGTVHTTTKLLRISLLTLSRESIFESIFAYSLMGAKHNIVLSGPLLDQLLANSNSLDEAELGKWVVPCHAFGLSPKAKDEYLKLRPELSKSLEASLFKNKQFSHLISQALVTLSQELPDLITFNSSIVDQMQWERVAVFELIDGADEVEADLFGLINEFFCSTILPLVTGDKFLESYQLLASDLASVTRSFYALALGLPRLFPIPGLPAASIARRRLLQNLTTFFDELTNPPTKRIIRDDESISGEEDTDADTPTPLTALNKIFEQHDVPFEARASITLDLLHRIVSQIVPLAFWTLLHIYFSSSSTMLNDEISPLVKIRGETKDWAKAHQPPSIHPQFPSPPAINFGSPDQALSTTTFPYLRSCIAEARRLYNSSYAISQVVKPITLTDAVIARPRAEEKWELEVGSYVDIGLSHTLISNSSADYLSPKQFRADRFLHKPPSVKPTYDLSEDFTTVLVLALVAGVTQLWEVAAAPKKTISDMWYEAQAAMPGAEDGQKEEQKEVKERKVGVWTVPKSIDGAYFRVPKREFRVRIRRREGLQGPKTAQKGKP